MLFFSFLALLLISENKVNLQAQLERHAKLKEENVQLKNTSLNSVRPKRSLVNFLSNKLNQLCNDQNENPMISKLSRRIISLTAAFLLIAPFIPSYQRTHGYYLGNLEGYGGEMGVMEFTEQSAEYSIADIMTEDGFLLKPAINSAEGDRTGFSEIFIYTVEPGDTLSVIASRFNIKKETLMAENNMWNPNRLRVGTKLKILPVNGLSHVVKKGETVEKLAKKYKVESEAIVTQNQLEEPIELATDRILIIPGAKRSAPVYNPSSAPISIASYSGQASAVGRLMWPAPGARLTQGYRGRHAAIDIGNRSKGPIVASAPGKVIKAASGWNGGYGNVVIIDHGNGMQTLYGHNEKLYVTTGQYVDQGQTIAWMGNSGRVYGPTGIHVHFEVRINGVKYNPMNFF